MTGENIYVVKRHGPLGNSAIQAVLSSEGLAQTHAAKLRSLTQDSTYTVEPLVLDEVADLELYYSALLVAQLTDPITQLYEGRIQTVLSGLGLQLPEGETGQFKGSTGAMYLRVQRYGWSLASARATVIAAAGGILDEMGLAWESVEPPQDSGEETP
jgi:hypothetical protein